MRNFKTLNKSSWCTYPEYLKSGNVENPYESGTLVLVPRQDLVNLHRDVLEGPLVDCLRDTLTR